MLLAFFQLGRVISPNLWGWLADHSAKRSYWIKVTALAGALFFIYSFCAESFLQILFVMMAMSIFTSSTIPLMESLTLSHLSINKGEFIYLIGKTGIGKSSLLKILYGDITVNDGNAKILDINLLKLKQKNQNLTQLMNGVNLQI